MATTPNPYANALADRDPLEALGETPGRLREFVGAWTDAQFARPYAPAKWTVRQIIVHLAQTELALGTRIRFALAEPSFVAQPFSQDAWLPLDESLDANTALDAYTMLRRMNVAMLRALPPERLDHEFSHPEYGLLTIRWVASQMAGHDIHHFRQIAAL